MTKFHRRPAEASVSLILGASLACYGLVWHLVVTLQAPTSDGPGFDSTLLVLGWLPYLVGLALVRRRRALACAAVLPALLVEI